MYVPSDEEQNKNRLYLYSANLISVFIPIAMRAWIYCQVSDTQEELVMLMNIKDGV